MRPSFVVLLMVVAVAAWVAAACNIPTRIDQAAATQIARDYFVSGQMSRMTVSDVKVLSIDLRSDAGRPAWNVNISGHVKGTRSAVAVTFSWWLYVDADTGEVRLVAPG